ncbi:hypothetical protein DER45DRAFT_602139 [Fusarium avenaceum]|nr:hypothetical protein DER45DRAFT_602139 [Fusarium avenaceum]
MVHRLYIPSPAPPSYLHIHFLLKSAADIEADALKARLNQTWSLRKPPLHSVLSISASDSFSLRPPLQKQHTPGNSASSRQITPILNSHKSKYKSSYTDQSARTQTGSKKIHLEDGRWIRTLRFYAPVVDVEDNRAIHTNSRHIARTSQISRRNALSFQRSFQGRITKIAQATTRPAPRPNIFGEPLPASPLSSNILSTSHSQAHITSLSLCMSSHTSHCQAKSYGLFSCGCRHKMPKKFKMRFKQKSDLKRHQESLHICPHSWSCSQRDWNERIRHLRVIHKFNECDTTKRFFRADHFRQHLKLSRAGKSGKWTNALEDVCKLNENQYTLVVAVKTSTQKQAPTNRGCTA